MSEHSKLFSPSAAKRRLACPGSASFEAQFPDKPSSFAMEGSRAHALAEWCLRMSRRADEHLGYHIDTKSAPVKGLDGMKKEFVDNAAVITVDMCYAVQQYLDIVRSRWTPGVYASVEARVEIAPDVFGTADHIAYEPFGPMWVDDYKHGRGVYVPAEKNAQAMCYAVGALNGSQYEHDRVFISIVQPRSKSGWSKKPWEISVPDLLAWKRDVLLPGIEACRDPNAPLHAGSHCTFCKAAGVCTALAKGVVDNTGVLPATRPGGAPVLPSPRKMGPADLGRVLAFAGPLETWLKEVKSAARGMIEGGEGVPGFKLVAGTSKRSWTDKAMSILPLTLGDKAYAPRKLVGIGEAEKELKLKGIDPKTIMPTVTKKPGAQPVLVPVDSPKKAIESAALRAFEHINHK